LKLPQIKTNSSSSEISRWKKSPEVAECYKNLFNQVRGEVRTISLIVEKVFLGKEYTKMELSYVVAVCTLFLNPKHSNIQIKESVVKSKVKYYKVGFVIL
jgi:hypothetical protein